MDPLLHSLSAFSQIYQQVLACCGVSRIGEIGVGGGDNTRELQRYVAARQGALTSIDPAPSTAALAAIEALPHTTLLRERSLDAIPAVTDADAWFVDGDHNWYTVFHELRLIESNVRRDRRPLLVFLHDVGWPCARRDLYYAPDSIPAEFRHAHDWNRGVVLGQTGLVEGRYRGMGAFAWACAEGGPRNGVQTAIEDFLAESPQQYHSYTVPGVFGMGVICSARHPFAAEIGTILAPYHGNTLLALLEENRLRNYLQLLAYQDAGMFLPAEAD